MRKAGRGTATDRLLRGLAAAALLLGACALVIRFLPDGAFDALYAARLYPALARGSVLLTGWTEVPLGIVLLPLVCAFILLILLRPGNGVRIGARGLGIASLAVVLAATYYLAWGANYRRHSLDRALPSIQANDQGERIDLLEEYLLAWLWRTQEADRDEDEAVSAIAGEMEELAAEWIHPVSLPRSLKTLPPGLLLRSGFSGMIFPYTLEPQVDGGLTDVIRVAVGSHELAHVAGLAQEADADLAAFVAAMRSGNEYARYAAALYVLSRILGQSSPQDRIRLEAALPPSARRDLQEARARTSRYIDRGLASVVTSAYDRFLEQQGVEGGVAEYGRLPRLAARALSAGLLPQLPPGKDAVLAP